MYHGSNPYINLTSEARENLHHFFLKLVSSYFELYIWARGLCFHPFHELSSSLTYEHDEHMRWPRKVSNILRTSVNSQKKNPIGKTLQNCFAHKSSRGSGKQNQQNSYYHSQRTLTERSKNAFYWSIVARTFRKNICSEADFRSRIFGTFVVKFLACLPLLGFSNIWKMV